MNNVVKIVRECSLRNLSGWSINSLLIHYCSLIPHVHSGVPLPLAAYQVSICVIDNPTLSVEIKDVFRNKLEKHQIFVVLNRVMQQLKPSILIYPSQNAVYKLDSDNVRSHLFMQALREVGARILETQKTLHDYTVKQVRVLFGSVQPAEVKQPMKSPDKPKPEAHIKPLMDTLRHAQKSAPSTISVISMTGVAKSISEELQFEADKQLESTTDSKKEEDIPLMKPSLSSILSLCTSLDDDEQTETVRPEPIDPYAVKNSASTEKTVLPRHGNHTFSYRSGKHTDVSDRHQEYEEHEDHNIYFSSSDQIDKDLFHIPYNIKYQFENYEGVDDGYFTTDEIKIIIEAINVTRHTLLVMDYAEELEKPYDPPRRNMEDHPQENYESMEYTYDHGDDDRSQLAYGSMHYDDGGLSEEQHYPHQVDKSIDNPSHSLLGEGSYFGRPRRNPIEIPDRKRKLPLLHPPHLSKRKPPFM